MPEKRALGNCTYTEIRVLAKSGIGLRLKRLNMTGEKSCELGLEIVPNSKEFAVMGFNPWTNSLRVKVKSKALEGKANRELAEGLSKLFGAKIRIIAGEKSRKKKILVEGVSIERLVEMIGSLRP